jgi:hypothetical protein
METSRKPWKPSLASSLISCCAAFIGKKVVLKMYISYVFCLVLALGIVLGNSQEYSSNEQNNNSSQQFRHPLTDMPGSSEDVVTSHYFPSHPDQKIPIGETVSVLCHFANDGKAIEGIIL